MSTDEGHISIPEAVALFNVSATSLRRRLNRGDLDGAFKVRGKRGSEWRIPLSALRTLGYQPVSGSEPDGSTELRQTIRNLTETLRVERSRWEEWDRRLGGALLEIARLNAQIRQLKRENLRLRAAAHNSPSVVDLTHPADR